MYNSPNNKSYLFRFKIYDGDDKKNSRFFYVKILWKFDQFVTYKAKRRKFNWKIL